MIRDQIVHCKTESRLHATVPKKTKDDNKVADDDTANACPYFGVL